MFLCFQYLWLKFFTINCRSEAREHRPLEGCTTWNLQLGTSTGWQNEELQAHAESTWGEAATGKVREQTLSRHCRTSKCTWIFPLNYPSFIVTIKLASVLVRVPCSWEGAIISSRLTHIPGWQFPTGTAEINLGSALMEASQLISSCHHSTLPSAHRWRQGLFEGDSKAACMEQDKWGSCKVSFPWKPSATNTLLSSVQDVYGSHINAGFVEKFAQWMPVLQTHASEWFLGLSVRSSMESWTPFEGVAC